MTEGGFLLNNELTDFSFVPVEDGKPVANRVEPRQAAALVDGADDRLRPRGRVAIVAGSPGGSAIIDYVVKTLLAMHRLEARSAGRSGAAEFRQPQRPDRAREGHAGRRARSRSCARSATTTRVIDQTSGVQAIVRDAATAGSAAPTRGAKASCSGDCT